MNFEKLSELIIFWAEKRDILSFDNRFVQYIKFQEEAGELARALIKDNRVEIEDAIGDILVTLIILSEQLGVTPEKCLELAFNTIKDRTGKVVNGSFVKN